MEFHRFRIDLDQDAKDVKIILDDDLIETRWFSKEEIDITERMP
ncbi:MAG: hypothetical protein WCG98_00440 [bacterium]